jgi:chromosome segregation ATPase
LIEYHLKYQQLEEARQAYEDKDQELDHKLQLIKELSDEATVLHVASIEKQGRMYKWVERALAVRAVITGLRYGHLSGSNQHEKHSYLMQIWMAIRRIITRLDDDVAEMRREHQEKLNTLRKLKFEVVRLDVELIDKEAELERILTEWEEVRANFKSANKP